MIRYKLIKENISHPDLGKYTAYGIGVFEGRKLIRKISDISTDKRTVRKLCHLCNKLSLSTEHLCDVADDALCL